MKLLSSNLKISDIIHNDLECYIKSGYGGKAVKKWPFYIFIKQFINGNHKQARTSWINWLVDEFYSYCNEIKSNGGMYQGSVHRYSLKFLKKNKKILWLTPSLLSKKAVKKGAATLVERRIKMINSIINRGFQINLNDPIIAVKVNGKYVLKGGHHRATVMYILGYKILPEVVVYSKYLWEIKIWLLKIKKFLR